METLLKLIDFGQSYWLDNLTRGMIKNGELKKRVEEQGLRGMTSNPSIFNKAISGSEDYSEQIEQLVGKGKAIRDIYTELVVKDVQDACDILRTVYDASEGEDGFVSLEVSPYLAHDTEGTMEEARRLFKMVDRPNLFIKIPGTDEGVPAIEQMLYEGININITLLFGIDSYEAVARAYIRALERRTAEGKPVKNVSSVASFFLSRIDVLVDQLLGHLIIPEKNQGSNPRPELLLGKVAIANGKLAYQSFHKIFSGERWQKLVDKGARVQRPLWASTSTKDPLYSDVRYVEPLIGPHTVNTMPEETIQAFADHGTIVENSVEEDLDEAKRTLDNLKAVGVDLDFVTRQLVNEGIQKFIDPFDELMKTLAKEQQKILSGGAATQTFDAGATQKAVQSAFKSLDDKQFARRLFQKDPYLWKSESDHIKVIRNRMGWMSSVELFLNKLEEITHFADVVKSAGMEYVVLLGMGGSSLAPEVARLTFGSADGYPKLFVLDNTDPAAILDVEKQITLEKTLFLVSSKSGTTLETLSFYKYFYSKLSDIKGEKAGNHFVTITDPGTPLVKEAHERKFRRIFENPKDLGGRYSALSYFGLVPMALIGINLKTLLENARQMQLSSDPFIPAERNPAVSLGTLIGMNYYHNRNKITFVLSESVSAYGLWVEQLIAESTGKENKGLLPVEGEPLGTPDVYGDDRVFVSIIDKEHPQHDAKEKLEALKSAGHPVVEIELQNKLSLGAEFFRWELATATAGGVMHLNPFDEPNVAESKKNTSDLLEEKQQKGKFSGDTPVLEDSGLSVFFEKSQSWLSGKNNGPLREVIKGFFATVRSGDYVSFLPYFMQTPENQKLLQELRIKIRAKHKTATTLGYGPRYLHSTGQLHKGGPNSGLFIIFTADASEELPIPEKKFGFATLQRAQALGDYRSLNDKKRRVIRIHLGSDIEDGLKKFSDLLG